MRKFLFLSLKFPPLSDIGAKRPLRMVRRLPRHGWEPYVLTLPKTHEGLQDPELEDLIPKEAKVFRSYAGGPVWGIVDAVKSAWSVDVGRATTDIQKRNSHAYSQLRGNFLARLADVLEGLTPTEEFIPFMPQGAVEAIRLVRKYNLEAIYVCGDPNSAYLAGAVAHLVTGKPLILDMRDPWTLDPTVKRIKKGQTQWVEEWLEERIFNMASAVILNTERARQEYFRYYPEMPRSKFHVIHNAFDRELVLPYDPPLHEKFTIAHFGNYSRMRTANVFLTGLSLFAEKHGMSLDDVQLINYGQFTNRDKRYADYVGMKQLVRVKPYVPYRHFLNALRRANLLLLEQRNPEDLQIPGKFYDYCITGRPILNLSNNLELETIMKEARVGLRADPDSPTSVAEALGEIYRMNLDEFEKQINREALIPYSAADTARRLANVLTLTTT